MVMGSGETSPTMVKVHRELLDALGHDSKVVILDTPVGFQLNASGVSAKAVEYFRTSLGKHAQVASLRSTDDPAVAIETALKQIRDADYVFAGPGSPTYALKQWTGLQLPDLLREKLRSGGCVTFASAAAVTLGRFTVPVYEIYKVGQPVHWATGLDLIAEARLPVAVVPHFNNREGGDHDTRFCYMGEPRLAALEAMLPDDTFILGIDEHTALIIDLDEDEAKVVGIGDVTVRVRGEHWRVGSTAVPLDEIRKRGGAHGLASVGAFGEPADHEFVARQEGEDDSSPFWDGVGERDDDFRKAFSAEDLSAAVNAALELDDHMWQWSTESFGTDELVRARALLRDMIVRIGEEARRGPRHIESIIGPFVDGLLEMRDRARAEGRFEDADAIRDLLTSNGVEVRDEPGGTAWLHQG